MILEPALTIQTTWKITKHVQ